MELLLCFVIIFAILTFVLSVKEMSYKKVFYKYKSDIIIIIPLYSDTFSEMYLKYRIDSIKNSNINICKVVLVDNGLDSEQYEICKNIIKNNNMLQFITDDELSDCIGKLLK